MNQYLLIGIDIGTTNIKFLAINSTGHTIQLVIKKMQVDYIQPGWTDFNISVLKNNIITGLKELTSSLPSDSQVISVGLDSIGESFVGLNSHGEVITPCPTWFDRRTENYREQHGIPVDNWYNLTGMVDDDIYTTHRINWFLKKNPDMITSVTHWLWVADYVIYLLSGEMVTVPSLAARTGFFDRNTLRWSPVLLEAGSISENMLPEILPTGRVAGHITSSVAHLTGLPAGTPLIHAGHDHPCAVLGCSISTPGPVIDSTGTAEAVNTLIPQALSFEDTLNGSYDCYPYVLPGLFSLSGHLPSSGGLFDWVIRLVSGVPLSAYPSGKQVEELLQEVDTTPPGSRGVKILPFMEGSGTPWHHRWQKAEIRELKSYHTRADLIRAAMEGVACWLKINIDTLSHIVGSELNPVIAIGGGSKNKKWLEIKSAMIQKPLRIPQIEEAAAQGSAFIGGYAVGYYPNTDISKHLKNITWSETKASEELISSTNQVYVDLLALFHEVLREK